MKQRRRFESLRRRKVYSSFRPGIERETELMPWVMAESKLAAPGRFGIAGRSGLFIFAA
jgi:hypothetical protein